MTFFAAYNRAGGGPIASGADLGCDFATPCCWTNDNIARVKMVYVNAKDVNGESQAYFPSTNPPSRTVIYCKHE